MIRILTQTAPTNIQKALRRLETAPTLTLPQATNGDAGELMQLRQRLLKACGGEIECEDDFDTIKIRRPVL